jgi:UDP-GlcNAc:undecaprenyl-phosphate GlcNAc-1-phosphate transferase
MRSYFAAFFVAFLSAALVTPLVLRLALRLGAVSHPGGRHVHRRAIPRLGGIAIYVAFLLPLGALLFVDSSVGHIVRTHGWRAGGLLAGATAITLLGVVDDTRGVRALLKLAVQVGVAAFTFACGYRIDAIALPMLGPVSMGVFAFPVTVLWITGIINAVNLIDGLDGLAAGVVLFAALTNFAIANIAGSVFIAVVMAATAGALLGFLLFNFNPARIFMGDSGSYLLGYVLAASVLAGSTAQKASTAVSLLVPCLALGVPIFDTLFSLVRRYLERRPLFSPDRGHIHHRLLDMGLTHRRAVLTLYGVSAIFSVAAIATSMGKDWQIGVAMLVSSVVLFALVRAAGYFEYFRNALHRRGRHLSPRAEAVRRALPAFVEQMAAAGDEGQVRATVDQLAKTLAFQRVVIVERTPGPRPSQRPDGRQRREVDVVEACFPLGADATAQADVLFVWSAGDGGASPEIDLLLELLVDVVERALARVGSALVHREPVAPTSVSSPASVRSPTPQQVTVTPTTLGTR